MAANSVSTASLWTTKPPNFHWHVHADNVAGLLFHSSLYITHGIGSICVHLYSEFIEKQRADLLVVKLDFTTEDSLH